MRAQRREIGRGAERLSPKLHAAGSRALQQFREARVFFVAERRERRLAHRGVGRRQAEGGGVGRVGGEHSAVAEEHRRVFRLEQPPQKAEFVHYAGDYPPSTEAAPVVHSVRSLRPAKWS